MSNSLSQTINGRLVGHNFIVATIDNNDSNDIMLSFFVCDYVTRWSGARGRLALGLPGCLAFTNHHAKRTLYEQENIFYSSTQLTLGLVDTDFILQPAAITTHHSTKDISTSIIVSKMKEEQSTGEGVDLMWNNPLQCTMIPLSTRMLK